MSTTFHSKLEQVWDEVSRDTAIDFLKKSVTSSTSVSEFLSVLSYDKIQNLKELLGHISLGDVVQYRRIKVETNPEGNKKKEKMKVRTKRDDLEKEIVLTLKTL